MELTAADLTDRPDGLLERLRVAQQRSDLLKERLPGSSELDAALVAGEQL